MNLFDKNIKEKASEIIENEGFFLVDILFRGNENNRIIEIFMDGEKNLTAEDCADISRKLSTEIEAGNLLVSNYRLIVSSPGIDRPLMFLKQYPKHINRKFEITYLQNEETKRFSAKLINISGNELTFLSNNNKEFIINFNNIKKAVVIPSFS